MAPSTNISQKYLFANGNNDIMSTVGQFGNLIPQITGKGYGEIAWFQQAIEAGVSGNAETIVKAAPNIIGGLAKLFGGGNSAKVEADDKVKATENKITNEGQKTQAQIDENQEQIEQIINEAEQKAQEIRENLDKIKDNEEKKAELEKRVENWEKTIACYKKTLEDPNSSGEVRDRAKQQIEVAGIALNGLALQVEQLNKNITEINESNETLETDAENLNQDAASLQTANQTFITQANAETQAMITVAENELTAGAVKDEANAVRLEEEAAALESGGVFTLGTSTVQAAKLIAEALNYHTAAGTYTSGITTSVTTTQTQIFTPLTIGSANFSASENLFNNYIGYVNDNLNECFNISNSLGSSWIGEKSEVLAQAGNEIIDAVKDNNESGDNNDNNDTNTPNPNQRLQKTLEDLETLTA